MRKGVQDAPNPAGIKNPNGEKAIERWGQGTDHQKNRHEGYVNTSPRYKSFAISRLATISLQTYRQKPARPMPYITLHTMDMTSSHIITLHTIQKQKIAKNKTNIQDLQNQEQPILRNKKAFGYQDGRLRIAYIHVIIKAPAGGGNPHDV